MLGDHLAALFLAAALFTPGMKRIAAAHHVAGQVFDQAGEEAAEREIASR